MDLPEGIRLRPAERGDLPAIADLRRAAGWSVHDWALEAVLDPSNAYCVVAVDDEGGVLAVGSGITYGALGFVGNMVVAGDHRRRGLGTAILADVVAFLEHRGCTRLELYATAEGRQLYARHGFELTEPTAFARVARDTALGPTADVALADSQPEDLERLAAYDAPRFGGDRRGLLAIMLTDADRPLVIARRGDEPVGYAWLRPEAGRLGPFVADQPAVAAALVAEGLRRAPDADTLTFSLPSSNRSGLAWLREAGAEVEPWDGRMARGPDVPRRDDTIYGHSVGALG